MRFCMSTYDRVIINSLIHWYTYIRTYIDTCTATAKGTEGFWSKLWCSDITYLLMRLPLYKYVNIYIYINTCIHIYIYIYVIIYVYIEKYISTYILTYVYVYIYTCIYGSFSVALMPKYPPVQPVIIIILKIDIKPYKCP